MQPLKTIFWRLVAVVLDTGAWFVMIAARWLAARWLIYFLMFGLVLISIILFVGYTTFLTLAVDCFGKKKDNALLN